MARIPNRLPEPEIGTLGVTNVAHFEDNEYFYFGTGDDARISYDGTDLKIEPAVVGSGKVDMGGHVSLPADDRYIYLGEGDDCSISYDGTDMKINPKEAGSGKVDFLGDVSLPADNRKIYLGESDDVYLYFDGTYLRMDSGTHEMAIKLSIAGRLEIYGGGATGDDIEIKCNTTDSYPVFGMYGNSYVTLALKAGQAFNINEEATAFCVFNKSGSTITFDNTTGNALGTSWATTTTTGNIVGLDIDASSNLTMGTNLGATGIKINVIAADGSGVSKAIDVSSLAVDANVLSVVADAITNPGTLSGQIAIDVAGTTYYLEYFTHGS